ncbi:hypothetical protein JTB14_005490 [Gonioctena quinquepunctata]|nr:hypothetical protein JTB14_005490 [Gonioctena quinquepunctata]
MIIFLGIERAIKDATTDAPVNAQTRRGAPPSLCRWKKASLEIRTIISTLGEDCKSSGVVAEDFSVRDHKAINKLNVASVPRGHENSPKAAIEVIVNLPHYLHTGRSESCYLQTHVRAITQHQTPRDRIPEARKRACGRLNYRNAQQRHDYQIQLQQKKRCLYTRKKTLGGTSNNLRGINLVHKRLVHRRESRSRNIREKTRK